MAQGDQFGRVANLIVNRGERALDLSAMRFRFQTRQADMESPNNCEIRIWNLSDSTAQLIRSEYTHVTLQCGYDGVKPAIVFTGTIKQFRRGKENATDTYLDLLAADGDVGYNFAVANKTLAAGSTPAQRLETIMESFKTYDVMPGYTMTLTGGVLPRGKVFFGMARALIRQFAATEHATWSINNGRVDLVPLTGYQPGQAVVLNSMTGLIGRPEQTQNGIEARCLINPRLQPGTLVQIDNASINQTIHANPNIPIPFNQRTGIQRFATVAADGIYRLFVVEHVGDTRGNEWYSDLVALAVNPVTQEVKPYG